MAKIFINDNDEETVIPEDATIDLNTKGYIIEHQMKTEKGDSGTPLIVQPPNMNNCCFVIGIHCSGLYQKGIPKMTNSSKALRITEGILKNLG